MRNSFVKIVLIFFLNMLLNIFSCLFHDANIKEGNIFDFNAAWTQANSYLTTNKKTQNTFIVCIRSQHLQKDETLCYNKKKNTHTQSLLRLLGGLRAMNGLENNIISKHLYHN